ncbi:MAG: biopolymer transport protein ExbD [Clostridiales bacterium]|jgi:biopolymer transport protein ExbD|nr:biopolymer transport protein ExbD [Clostridiales bacterium]MDN5281771.1 biopolymer transport protein ExbD [Candidatus Ozemobacter sp.]
MSLRKLRKRQKSPMLDLTGASDIIFTLLLFYILTQNFLPTLEVNLPALNSENRQQNDTEQVIVLEAEGNFIFNGRSASLAEIKESPHEYFAGLKPELLVTLRVDKKSPAGHMVELMDILAGLGFSSLSFQGVPDVGKP